MFGFGCLSRAPAAIACAIGLATLSAPLHAQNQLGDFRQWLPGVFGGVGVDPANPGGFTLLIDDDGDPFTPPVEYNLGAQAPELENATNYFLSPTRRTLYVLSDDFSGTQPSRVWFVDLDGQGGVDIRHGPFALTGQFGDARVQGGPFYYESFGGLRTAVLVLGDAAQTELWAQVFDLNTPGLVGTARADLERGWERGWFSPGGEYLVVKNGLNDTDTQFVDYTLINTCGLGADFGASSDIRVSGLLVPPDPVFTVTRIGGGTMDVVGQIAGQPNAVFSGTLPACDGTVGPELGACCISLGTSTICVDGVTQIECGGGTFGPGMTCEELCPQPTVEIVGGVQSSVLAGTPLVYSFAVENTGSVLAEDVLVFGTAPAGTTIDSVSVGGIITAGMNADWTIPSIAPGGSAVVTMTVTAPCQPGPLLLESAAYGARIGAGFFSGADLLTDVRALSDGDITVSVQSTPQGSTPAIQGDTALHTVTMTNNGPIVAQDITLDCFGLGNGNTLEAVIDNAGGQVTTGLCGVESIAWTGSLNPGETRTLVFTTRLGCVSQSFPGGPLGVLLNRGVDITVSRGMPCASVISRATPMRIDSAAPMSARLSYNELAPGTLRFNAVDAAPLVPAVVGLGRLGEAAEVVLTIRNDAGPDLPNAAFEYSLGASWEVSGNPFIGTPPAGITFDGVTEIVRYDGPLATGETLEVRMSLVMSSPDRPDDGVVLMSSAGCDVPALTARDAEVYAVPPTPGVTHVHGVSGFDHYRHDAPLGDGVDARLPDFYFELLAGIDAGSDNSLYVADVLFSYVINPDTLFFGVFDGVAFPQDPDPASGGVLHAMGSSLFRYLPDGTRVLVFDDPSGQTEIVRAAVTDDGVIHALVQDSTTFTQSVVSLDPSGATLPLGPADLTGAVGVPVVSYPYEADWGGLLSRVIVGFADDGTDLLALVQSFWAGPNQGDGGIVYTALVRIDPGTRAVTVVEPELAFFRQPNGPPLPQGSQPVFQGFLNGIVAVSGSAGPIFDVNFGEGYSSYDPATRLPVGFILRQPGVRYNDLVLIERGGCGPADLTGDGVLDSDDITAFGVAFAARDASVDFDGNGIFDLGDISGFIALFTAGCP